LTQGFDRDGRHFDETRCAVLFQIFRAAHVRGIDDGDRPAATIISALVLQNWPNAFRGLIDGTGKGASGFSSPV
jgi:hypothetical protein